jgi:hypothetical protein
MRTALLALGCADMPFMAHAQDDLKARVPGVYTLAAVYDQLADGKKNDTWGTGVQGRAIFTPSGYFSITIASANRKPTAGETPRDPVGPIVSYYGTYQVDEASKTLNYHLEQATFPGWNNFDRHATIETASATELNFVSLVKGDPKLGDFTAHLNWKREGGG